MGTLKFGIKHLRLGALSVCSSDDTRLTFDLSVKKSN